MAPQWRGPLVEDRLFGLLAVYYPCNLGLYRATPNLKYTPYICIHIYIDSSSLGSSSRAGVPLQAVSLQGARTATSA